MDNWRLGKIISIVLFIMFFCLNDIFAQEKTVIVLPQKNQIIADKKPRKIWMQNKVNRDSVVQFIFKVAEHYNPEKNIVVSDKALLNGLSEYSKLRKVKHFESVDHSQVKIKFLKKLLRNKKKIKHYSLVDTQETKSKIFEIRNKYYGDYILVINRFRLNSKGKWNLAFRNITLLELHYDLYDKNNNKVASSVVVNRVNLKYDMYMSAFWHLIEGVLNECISELDIEKVSQIEKSLK